MDRTASFLGRQPSPIHSPARGTGHIVRRVAGRLLQAAVSFLSEEGWHPQIIEEEATVRTGFAGSNGNFACYGHGMEDTEQFVFYSVVPVPVPAGKRQAMAELLTRINSGLVLGSFEMDFDDGEVRFKTAIDVEDAELTPALLRGVVYGNVFPMDVYLPAILSLVYSETTPVQALALVSEAESEVEASEPDVQGEFRPA